MGAVVSHGMWLWPKTSTSVSGNRAAQRASRPLASPVSWTTANRMPSISARATSGSRWRKAPWSLLPYTADQPAGALLEPVEQGDVDPVAGVHDDVRGVDRRPQGMR